MKRKIHAGATALIERVFIRDTSQTAKVAGLVGLTASSAGLTCYYCRAGANASTAVTLAAGTLGTWSSGGFVALDATNMPGWYEFGVPNAAVASGASSVGIHFRGAANMEDVPLQFELDQLDYQDSTRAGLLALPNAAAAATGGLPTVDANGAVKLQSGTGANQISLTGGQVTVGSIAGVTFPANFGVLAIAATTGQVGIDLTSIKQATVATTLANITVPAVTTVTNSVTVGGYAAGQDPATLVLDVAASGHDIAGSIGHDINAAGTASDPWTTALPGSYAIGTAGNLIGNTFGLTISGGTVAANTTQFAGSPVVLDAHNYPGVNVVDLAGNAAQAASGAFDANIISVNGTTFTGANVPINAVEWGGVAVGGMPNATAPPTVAQVATAVWTDPTASDFTTLGTPGRILVGQLGGAFTSNSSSVFTAAALVNAPTGGGGADPWATALPGTYAAGTAGAIVGSNLDAKVSTRSTYAGGAVASVTAPVTAGTVNDKTGYSLATAPPTTAQVAAAILATPGVPLANDGAGRVAVNLAQTGLTPRALDGVADAALTVGDGLVCAIAVAAGRQMVVGTTYTVETPSTGTAIRTFTLDSATAPTSRT